MPHRPVASPRILITGFGLITPLGHSAWQTFAALLAGRTLADRAAGCGDHVAPVDLARAVGCVAPCQHTASDPSVELAERAAREALMMAGAEPAGMPCVIGTSKGAVHALTRAADRLARPQCTSGQAHTSTHMQRAIASPSSPMTTAATATMASPPAAHTPHTAATDATLAVALGPHGYLSHHLRRRLGLGLVSHRVAACASSLSALHHARLTLLQRPSAIGGGRRVLVVTSDAALLPMFIAAYRRLGVLAPLTPRGYVGRPLDTRRAGFMVAEAGAAVVLERHDDPAGPTPPGAIELVDTDQACEAFDLVRSSPGLPALRRVADRLLAGRRVDLLHPHAPGTVDNDPAEWSVYADAFGANGNVLPDAYACKGALGHSLGAAGLVSLVIACLCARTGRRPPMPWLTHPLESTPALTPHGRQGPIKTQAVFAAGFGGHVAGALIQRLGQ